MHAQWCSYLIPFSWLCFSVVWTFCFLCPRWKAICDFCLCFSSLTAKRPLSQCLQLVGLIFPVFSQNSAALQIWFWGSLRAIPCSFNQAHLGISCALILPSASTNMTCPHTSWTCTQATMFFLVPKITRILCTELFLRTNCGIYMPSLFLQHVCHSCHPLIL